MKKYLGRLAFAALALTAGTAANAQDLEIGPAIQAGGCTLDDQYFTLSATPTATPADMQRPDFDSLTKTYIQTVQYVARLAIEDYTSAQVAERPFSSHLTFAINDITWRFNNANQSGFGLAFKGVDLVPHPGCKTLPRVHAKP